MRRTRTRPATFGLLALAVALLVALGDLPVEATLAPGPTTLGTGQAPPDSWSDVAALEAATADRPGVRLGVVADRNGRRAGGQASAQVVVPPDRVRHVLARLRGLPGVVAADVDEPVHLLGVDPLAPQQLSRTRTGADLLPATFDGSGTVVAVVDTGVDGRHPDLAPPLRDGRPRVLRGTTFLPGEDEDGRPGTTDPSGHGTHAAGTVAAARNDVGTAGLADGAQILPVRVVSAGGSGFSSDLAAGIRWAHDNGADVISISLGATGTVPALVSEAVAYATTDRADGRRPSVVVAAAGNAGAGGADLWPAMLPNVVAVGATDDRDQVVSFSTRAPWVDLVAPGTDVLSTCAGGTWCTMTGTSVATPVVSAAAALLLAQDRTRSAATVAERLVATARDLGPAGRDTAAGAGLVRPAQALGLADVAVAPGPPGAPVDVQAACFPTACQLTFRTVGEQVRGTYVEARTSAAGPVVALAGSTTGTVVVASLSPGTGYAFFLRSGGAGGFGDQAVTLARTPGTGPPPRATSQRRSTRRRAARRPAVRRAPRRR